MLDMSTQWFPINFTMNMSVLIILAPSSIDDDRLSFLQNLIPAFCICLDGLCVIYARTSPFSMLALILNHMGQQKINIRQINNL